jgi:hypothetical protein
MLSKALAGKKGEKKSEKDESQPTFYSYTEVKSIKLSEVPDKNFDIPEGYKLAK